MNTAELNKLKKSELVNLSAKLQHEQSELTDAIATLRSNEADLKEVIVILQNEKSDLEELVASLTAEKQQLERKYGEYFPPDTNPATYSQRKNDRKSQTTSPCQQECSR